MTTTESNQQTPPVFVHPIEAEFARILDYYHIPWEYEPRTFALHWDDEGNITEAFSPDFYLPDSDLYVELTTLRPKLITKKTANYAVYVNFIQTSISNCGSVKICAI